LQAAYPESRFGYKIYIAILGKDSTKSCPVIMPLLQPVLPKQFSQMPLGQKRLLRGDNLRQRDHMIRSQSVHRFGLVTPSGKRQLPDFS
jgi:hypothetical protein